jgi:sodium transport system permease protein
MEPTQAPHAPAFTASQASSLFVLVVVVLLLVQAPLAAFGVAGIVLAQLAFGGLPVLAAWMYFGAAAPAALALRWPGWRPLAGAACVGASFWYINLTLVVPLAEKLGGKDDLAQLETLVAETPFWLMLATMAVLPAICEELLLRSVVARAFVRRLGRAGAILASAALFALIHGSATRFLPMVCFGVILAHATLVTGSVVPSMLMHAVNNVIALLLSVAPRPDLATSMDASPAVFLAGAVLMCVVGLAVLNLTQSNPG